MQDTYFHLLWRAMDDSTEIRAEICEKSVMNRVNWTWAHQAKSNSIGLLVRRNFQAMKTPVLEELIYLMDTFTWLQKYMLMWNIEQRRYIGVQFTIGFHLG